MQPDWNRINLESWFADVPSTPIDLVEKLSMMSISKGRRFRYRLRANPSVCQNGKRVGLYSEGDQDKWINRQGDRHGFSLLSIHRNEEQVITGKRRIGQPIKLNSVLFDGILVVKDEDLLSEGVLNGIGHGKAMGLGLLSIVPRN